jgi:flagellar basal body-associated protein FliL
MWHVRDPSFFAPSQKSYISSRSFHYDGEGVAMSAERASAAEASAETEKAGGELAGSRKGGGLGGVLARQWLALVILLIAFVVQGGTFAYLRLHPAGDHGPVNPEVDLGTFHFEADKSEGGRTVHANFSLHVALLEPVVPATRDALLVHKYRVQQAVEELLRQAHGGDFEDTALRDLKRQIQEQINQTLGARLIAAVILTDLKLQREGVAKPSIDKTADDNAADRLP